MADTTKNGAGDILGRIEKLEALQAFHDLVSNYCHGVDKHDLDRFMDIWWDDATWAIGPPFGNFHTAPEIRRAVTDVIWPAWRETHHWTTNLVVSFDSPDRAHGVCDVDCKGASPDDVMQLVSATYTDAFERRGGVWRIARRDVAIQYFSAVPGVALAPPVPA
jgi:gamma-hexachlorocyclohexane dehydrochlorinase